MYDERACGRGQAECDSATALNRGIFCRCGNETEGQGCAEGLWKGCRDESHAATAPNHGICCRCGNGTENFYYFYEQKYEYDEKTSFARISSYPDFDSLKFH